MNKEGINPHYNIATQIKRRASVEQPKTEEKRMSAGGEKAVYAVGGAVVGASMTMVGQAVAAPSAQKEELIEEKGAAATTRSEENSETLTSEGVTGATVEATGTTVHVTGNAKVEIENGNIYETSVQTAVEQQASSTIISPEQHTTPEPEDAIVATATGVRVAQVDENASFSQAFADARAQVGPGGVFEWHGRAYGTYYKDEWDNMTAEQKQEYQTSIDYKDVISGESITKYHSNVSRYASYHEVTVEPESPNSSQEVAQEDVDVQVLKVGQTDLNGDGIPENAAVLEVNGHEVLVVDIDQDGIADAAICDIDNDGQVEIADLSSDNMAIPNQSADDDYMSQAYNAPDYINDAIVEI